MKKVIAWVVLFILIGMLLFLNYVKFFMNDNKNIKEVPVDNGVSSEIDKALMDIVSNFNENEKITEYENKGIRMHAVVNNHSIFVSYTENDTTITYEFTYNNYLLLITVLSDEENINRFRYVYEVLVYAVQERLGNTENVYDYVASFWDGSLKSDGLFSDTEGDNTIYTINIVKKLSDKEDDSDVDSDEEIVYES